ncbi:MAG: M48 family metallopeptidase [Gammaproteobacteria bacterium]|nr:M48 family metallopeptidase [Gammaproteobacteria bacterium]
MARQIRLGDIAVDVVLKDIKNVHLSVYPPNGRVRIAAPSRMKLDTIRVFAVSKLTWIKRQQIKIREQERETNRLYLDRESHYLWGQRYLLTVLENERAPSIELKHRRLLLRVRPGTSTERKQAIMEAWYRDQLRAALAPLVAKWQPRLRVKVDRIFIQRMKTRWGGCTPGTRSLRVNTELAKKPIDCLEYILVHEMAHLRHPNHGPAFVALMDQLMPNWRLIRAELNRLPVRHEDWGY